MVQKLKVDSLVYYCLLLYRAMSWFLLFLYEPLQPHSHINFVCFHLYFVATFVCLCACNKSPICAAICIFICILLPHLCFSFVFYCHIFFLCGGLLQQVTNLCCNWLWWLQLSQLTLTTLWICEITFIFDLELMWINPIQFNIFFYFGI